jgi:hypothetical protein
MKSYIQYAIEDILSRGNFKKLINHLKKIRAIPWRRKLQGLDETIN